MITISHRFPTLYPVPLCADCQAREDAAEEARKTAIEAEDRAALIASRLATIPPEMRRTRPDHPAFNARLWSAIRAWQPNRRRWLGIVGDAGRSKTRCLAMLAERLIRDGHVVTWTTATEMQGYIDDLRSDTRGIAEEARVYLRRIRGTSILVLDDFGKNTWTPTFERHMFELIDHRKTHDLPVLWSANEMPQQLHTKRGDVGGISNDRSAPIVSRLIEISDIRQA